MFKGTISVLHLVEQMLRRCTAMSGATQTVGRISAVDNTHMSMQGIQPRECLFAAIAYVWPLDAMDALVSPQIVRSHKGGLARLADEGTLPLMHAVIICHCSSGGSGSSRVCRRR